MHDRWRRAEAPAREALGDLPGLVCFSHLRWGFVWQRPQHLLSRLARLLPVYLVEEPVFAEGVPELRVAVDGEITLLTPQLPAGMHQSWGFNTVTNPMIRDLTTTFFADRGLLRGARPWTGPGPITWYYTPMAFGAEPADLDPGLIIFDAMDDLASFRGAPAELRSRESALMASADLVFTGGPSLYEARRDRHPSVHCFPSGVEPAHFAQAARGGSVPADLAVHPQPVLGFYGVLDERLDLDLLAAVADARPDWTIALVGPVVKIDPADLPQRPNIAYYGKQAYEDLPRFLAGFDVALLPFARNEATRFISPTKTLEYLAGGKPVVATSIPDVVSLYGEVVRFADEPTAFVAAVEDALMESPAERERRSVAAARLLPLYDWDTIADRIRQLMEEALMSPAALADSLSA